MMRPMKLLIVDDHSIIREGLSAVLSRAMPGAEVLHAHDGPSGLAALEANADLDAVFLDLNMPGGGGMAAITAFGTRRPGLPIVILSSSEDPADVRRALSLGALGYVPKSASPNTLVSALSLVLSGAVYVPPLMLDAALPHGGGARTEALTGRQIEVLGALANGLSNKEIAIKLDLAEKTVKAHVGAIFRALNVVNRTQAANAARAAELIPSA
ncbi:MAG: two component transcriptional regulator, LuxR family [Caulobacter sp.]|nr:two component transcriptional regulator, LuxR family [Caulobacter sp.]